MPRAERDEPVDDADEEREQRPQLGEIDMREGERIAEGRRQAPATPVVGVDHRDRVRPFDVGAGERCLALGEERGDALTEVVRLGQLGLGDCFELELLGERRRLGPIEQPLRLPDRSGRHGGEQGCDFLRAMRELVRRYDLVCETPGPRLLCTEPAPGRQPLERARRAEQASHEPGATRVGDEADVDERGHEARRVGGDPDVAGESERHAGARCGAVDGGDHGLLERTDREHVAVVVRAKVLGDVARAGRELLQVLADAEPAPGTGDHDGADRRILRLLERAAEPVRAPSG